MFLYLSGSFMQRIGGSIVIVVRRNRRSLLICFVFKNSIMGHMPTSMRGLSDVEESNFLIVAPPAAAAAAPPPIVPVGWLTLF